MNEEYTIREYLEHLSIKLNYKTRVALGHNAVKVAIRINGDKDKKWKSEKNCRPKGARVWRTEILKEVFDEGMIKQTKRMIESNK